MSRYDIKGKQYLQSGEKYYATDVTMIYALLGRKNIDLGHILEKYSLFRTSSGVRYFLVAYAVRNKKYIRKRIIFFEN